MLLLLSGKEQLQRNLTSSLHLVAGVGSVGGVRGVSCGVYTCGNGIIYIYIYIYIYNVYTNADTGGYTHAQTYPHALIHSQTPIHTNIGFSSHTHTHAQHAHVSRFTTSTNRDKCQTYTQRQTFTQTQGRRTDTNIDTQKANPPHKNRPRTQRVANETFFFSRYVTAHADAHIARV